MLGSLFFIRAHNAKKPEPRGSGPRSRPWSLYAAIESLSAPWQIAFATRSVRAISKRGTACANKRARALCSTIRQQVEEVEIDVECDELELSIDRALPVGLILNETAMNSIKHAFDRNGGRIKVHLVGGVGYGEARLTVSDNGRGIQKSNERGSGLKLIASLAKQIGGDVQQQSAETGTTTTLTFPLMT
jgi:two-component sensor histidine kinase